MIERYLQGHGKITFLLILLGGFIYSIVPTYMAVSFYTIMAENYYSSYEAHQTAVNSTIIFTILCMIFQSPFLIFGYLVSKNNKKKNIAPLILILFMTIVALKTLYSIILYLSF
jgi:uncharacterized membrane protein